MIFKVVIKSDIDYPLSNTTTRELQ